MGNVLISGYVVVEECFIMDLQMLEGGESCTIICYTNGMSLSKEKRLCLSFKYDT